ncbi:MAG: DNA primase [Acidobacteria bacterium]|nr:DNA primase [Acidobacteriota bacterium]
MDFVEQLKSSVDIVRVVGEYVPLKRVGAGPRYTGLCPFHTEKTPSFSVHSGHQFYKCFGCGAGGDVLKFVMEIERLTFPEALKSLAERYGIPMPKRAEYSDPESKLRAAVYEMHEIAAQVFRASLEASAGAEARAYLSRRGVTPALAEQFGLGYSDRSGQALTPKLQDKFSPEQLERSGLVLKRSDGTFFDRFRGRLIFPIHNESGKVIGFGGRALAQGDEPKYLNSPETSIYRKSFVLYNLHRAKEAIRKRDSAVLVEGYMDAIGVFAAGVQEVVASCGTALSQAQVRCLKRHSATIVVNFDPDTAGANAAERSIQALLDEAMRVRILELDGDLDPDEYVSKRGAEAYRSRLQAAQPYFLWLADRARKKFDMRTAEGRVAGFKWLLPPLQRISDAIERAAVANEVADFLGVDRGVVLREFRKQPRGRDSGADQSAVPALRRIEVRVIRFLLADSRSRSAIFPHLCDNAAVAGFQTGALVRQICALHEHAPDFSFSELRDRLSEADKAMLESLILADNCDQGDGDSVEQVIQALESECRQFRVADLRSRIRDAERRGDLAEALRLTEQMSQVRPD